jgi:hypothetical protein
MFPPGVDIAIRSLLIQRVAAPVGAQIARAHRLGRMPANSGTMTSAGAGLNLPTHALHLDLRR